MSARTDRILALVLSCIGLALALYAIAVDSHSQLAPRPLALQGFVGIALVLVSATALLSILALAVIRKSWIYLIPFCGWLVAMARLLLLWT